MGARQAGAIYSVSPPPRCALPCRRRTRHLHPSCVAAVQVVARANANEYGLAAGVFGKDIDVVNTITRALRVGTVWVNCYK